MRTEATPNLRLFTQSIENLKCYHLVREETNTGKMLQDIMIREELDSLFAMSWLKEKLPSLYVDYHQNENLQQFINNQMGQSCKSICLHPENTLEYGEKEKQFILENLHHIDKEKILQQLEKHNFYDLQDRKCAIFKKGLGLYIGQINQELHAHGRGKFVYLEGNIFEGCFEDNKFHGQGVFKNKNNSITFVGVWDKGNAKSGVLMHHQGLQIKIEKIKKIKTKLYQVKVQISNKAQYEGELVQCKEEEPIFTLEGKGKMKFPDDSNYEGSWCKGLMDGLGKYNWPDGSYYQGSYQNGKRNGWGKIYLKKYNKMYEGYWQKGCPRLQSYIQQNPQQSNSEMPTEDQL